MQGVSHGYQYAARLQPHGGDNRHQGRSGPLQAKGSGGTIGGSHGCALSGRHVGGCDWFGSITATTLTGGQTTVNVARPHYITIPGRFRTHLLVADGIIADA